MRVAAAALLVAVLLVSPAAAYGDQPFAPRFTATSQGDIALIGNGVLSCVSTEAVCPAARDGTASPPSQNNNTARVLTYVDSDDDPGTFNSSEAALTLPPGARVLFAGLYWGGRAAAGTGGAPAPDGTALGVVKLRAPGDTGYRRLTTSTIYTASQFYQSFIEVTDIVADAGPGPYRVADVQVGTGRNDLQVGGWALVVVYGSIEQPSRSLAVFDGLQNVSTTGPPVSIALTDFLTPASGPVRSTIGIVAQDGDRGTVSDTAHLNATPLANGLSPANNVFNSTITSGGRIPDHANTFGWDAETFDTVDAIGNRATSANVLLTTAGDAFAPGVVTIATELFAPQIEATKTVTGPALLGAVLTYDITVRNTGEDDATNFVLTDPVPERTTFVPGSAQILGGAPGTVGLVGDAVVAELGTLAVGASRTVRFQVRIDASGIRLGTFITNRARADFTADTTGAQDEGVETAEVRSLVGVPDLGIVKSHSPAYVPGATSQVHLVVQNRSLTLATGRVEVTDTFPAGLIPTGASGDGWACAVAAPTVTCTRTAGPSLFPPITIPVQVTPDATPGSILNTATVTNALDGNPDNDASTDPGDLSEPSIDLRVGKRALTTPFFSFGFVPAEIITYEIAVTNAGISDAPDVVVTDQMPPHWVFVSIRAGQGTCELATVTCMLGTLAAGATAVVTVEAAHDVTDEALAAFPSQADVANSASATGAGDEVEPADNEASASIRTAPISDAFVEKSFSPAQAVAGRPLTYTLRVGDHGPATSNITVHDDLPAELLNPAVTISGGTGECVIEGRSLDCVIPQVTAGTERTITVTGTLAAASAGTRITNAVEVGTGDSTGEFFGDNNTDEVSFVVGTPPPQPARAPATDVGVTVARPRGPATVGVPGTWRVEVVNHGPDAATGTTLTTTTSGPARAAQNRGLGTLAAGERRTVTLRLRPRAPGRITLSARVRANEADAIAPNDADTASVVARRAAMELFAAARRDTVSAGDRIVIVARAQSIGRRPARGARICIRRVCENGRSLRLVLRAPKTTGTRRLSFPVTLRGSNFATRRARVAVLVAPPPTACASFLLC